MGAKHSLQGDVDDFVSGLKQLHALSCCLSSWAAMVEDAASGRVETDLAERDLDFIKAAQGIPRGWAGAVGLLVKDQVAALRGLVEPLREAAKKMVDARTKMHREADALVPPVVPAAGLVEGGASRAAAKAIGRILECPAGECDSGAALDGVDEMIKQAQAAWHVIDRGMKDPTQGMYMLRYEKDPSLTDARFNEWIDRNSAVLTAIARESRTMLRDHRSKRIARLGSLRRAIAEAAGHRSRIAADFGFVIAKVDPRLIE